MNACAPKFKFKLAICISLLVHVSAETLKSNVTLEEGDERAFFSRLRKSIKRHSSSEEDDGLDPPERSKPRLTHFGEALISCDLSEAEESLKEDLEDSIETLKHEYSTFVHYKTFMTYQMHPLIEHYVVRAKRGTEKDKDWDFKYVLIPRIGAGNVAYIIHFKIIEDAKNLKKEAKAGLKAMKKVNMGHQISKQWPRAEKNIKIMIVFCGSDLALTYSKKKKR